MTIEQIREDLREIRYYYSMQEMIDKSAKKVCPRALLQKVERYAKAMENAPARIYVVYISLYVNNNSQTALADDWGYSREYVRDLHSQLVAYLQSALE